MEQLVNISQATIGNESEVNSVNARDIWKYLEIKKDFSDWVKVQLRDFEENSEYIMLPLKVERQILKEYIVTLDVAKHIAMMSRSPKGREIRQYFIDYEKGLISKVSDTIVLKQNITDVDNYTSLRWLEVALRIKRTNPDEDIKIERVIKRPESTIKVGNEVISTPIIEPEAPIEGVIPTVKVLNRSWYEFNSNDLQELIYSLYNDYRFVSSNHIFNHLKAQNRDDNITIRMLNKALKNLGYKSSGIRATKQRELIFFKDTSAREAVRLYNEYKYSKDYKEA